VVVKVDHPNLELRRRIHALLDEADRADDVERADYCIHKALVLGMLLIANHLGQIARNTR
jgi:hypothetical protein